MNRICQLSAYVLIVLSVYTENLSVSGQCSPPSTYLNAGWFQFYLTDPNGDWIYALYSSSQIVTTNQKNSTIQRLTYTCQSSFTSGDYYYYLYNSDLVGTVCAKSSILSGGSALFVVERQTDTITSAQDCATYITPDCLAVSSGSSTYGCSAVWKPKAPPSGSPAFTKVQCPIQGTYQLTVTYTQQECAGNAASKAVATGNTIQLTACDGTAKNSTYKQNSLLSDTLSCLGDIDGSVNTVEETRDGVRILLLASSDNKTIYCAKYSVDAGTVLLSIDVSIRAMASCGNFNVTTAKKDNFLALKLTSVMSSTPHSTAAGGSSAAGATTAAAGGSTHAAGGSTAAAGQHTTAAAGQHTTAAAAGGSTHAAGGSTAAAGGSTAAAGQHTTAAAGQHTTAAAAGGSTHAAGGSTAAAGGSTAAAGGTTAGAAGGSTAGNAGTTASEHKSTAGIMQSTAAHNQGTTAGQNQESTAGHNQGGTTAGQNQGTTAGQNQGTSGAQNQGTTAGSNQGGTTAGSNQGGTTGGQNQGGSTAGQNQGQTTAGQNQGGSTANSNQGVTTAGQNQGGTSAGQNQGGSTAGQNQGVTTAGQNQGSQAATTQQPQVTTANPCAAMTCPVTFQCLVDGDGKGYCGCEPGKVASGNSTSGNNTCQVAASNASKAGNVILGLVIAFAVCTALAVLLYFCISSSSGALYRGPAATRVVLKPRYVEQEVVQEVVEPVVECERVPRTTVFRDNNPEYVYRVQPPTFPSRNNFFGPGNGAGYSGLGNQLVKIGGPGYTSTSYVLAKSSFPN